MHEVLSYLVQKHAHNHTNEKTKVVYKLCAINDRLCIPVVIFFFIIARCSFVCIKWQVVKKRLNPQMIIANWWVFYGTPQGFSWST